MIIRAFFGLDKNPFSLDNIQLLPHQQDVFDILSVHSKQGGLCLLMGEPGTGKTVIKCPLPRFCHKNAVFLPN